MKKKLLVLGLGLLALVLSGCMDIESRYYIYPDGSGKNTTVFSMDPTKMMGMAGSFMGGMMPGGMPGATKGNQNPLEEFEKQGISGISEIDTTFTLYFNDVHKFTSEGIKSLVWERKKNLYHLKFVSDLNKFQEKFAPKMPEGTPEDQKQAGEMGMMMQMQMLKGMKISFVVVMPGEIVKSSGKFKGREARWEMTIDELMKKKELTIEAFSKPPSPQAESEFKKFKEELAKANKKFKEAISSLQQMLPTK